MQSAKFEFVLKKNKAENRILNDFFTFKLQIKISLKPRTTFSFITYPWILVVGNPSCDNRLARKSAPRFDSTKTRVLSVPTI